MQDDIAFLTATELVALYRARKLSPVEATRAALDATDRHNSSLNSYCFVDHDGALAAARESESRWQRGQPSGLIDGVPVSVKDLFDVKGTVTTAGSRVREGLVAQADAPAVAQLRRQLDKLKP